MVRQDFTWRLTLHVGFLLNDPLVALSKSHLGEVVVALDLERDLARHRLRLLPPPPEEAHRLIDRLGRRRLSVGRRVVGLPQRLRHDQALAHEVVYDEVAVPDLHFDRL